MAWIQCEDKLFSNPMTARLAGKMGWTINAAGGAILRLRCWCIDFAPDGDLRPFAPGEIAIAIGESPADGEKIVTAFIESQWLETTPYFRVSYWWQTTGLFLRGRFKREPGVWKRIERLYAPPMEERSSMECPSLEEKGDDTSPGGQNVRMAEVGPRDDQSSSAPEQLQSSSGTAPGPLAPILPHLIPAYLNITDLQQRHHQPESSEGPIDPKVSEPRGNFVYSRLAREICAYAGARRFSLADVKELRRLAETHGEELLEACRHLHGGIVNVPAYLRAIFSGSGGGGRIGLKDFK